MPETPIIATDPSSPQQPIPETQPVQESTAPKSVESTLSSQKMESSEVVQPPKQQSKALLFGVIAATALLAAGVGAWYWWTYMYSKPSTYSQTPGPSASTQAQNRDQETPDGPNEIKLAWWDGTVSQTYTDDVAGATFNYPTNHTVLSNQSNEVLAGVFKYIVISDENMPKCQAIIDDMEAKQVGTDMSYANWCLGFDGGDRESLERYTLAFITEESLEPFRKTIADGAAASLEQELYNDAKGREWIIQSIEFEGRIRLEALSKDPEVPFGLRMEYLIADVPQGSYVSSATFSLMKTTLDTAVVE